MDIISDLKDQLLGYYDSIISLLPKLAIAVVILIIFSFVVRFLRKRTIKFARSKADDQLLINFLDSIFSLINFIIGFLLFLYIIGQTGIASSILGAAGVSAFVIGFAFKDIGENFLAGVIMAFNRPFRIGDTIKTADVEGSIVEMSLRDTHIKTFDGKDVYVPNGQILKNPLYNYTIDGYLRKQFTIGIDYGSDIKLIRSIILDTINKVPGVLTETKVPATILSDFAASTIDITVQFWINTLDKEHSSVEVRSQAMTNVLAALDAANVNMPGDVVELKNYRAEGLKTAS